MKKIKMFFGETGLAILGIVFIATFVLMVMVFGILLNSNTNIKQSVLIAKSNRAFYLADGGIAEAVAQLRQDPDNLASISSTTLQGQYSVNLSSNVALPGLVIANSCGTNGQSVRKIRAEIATESPGDYFGNSANDLVVANGSDLTGAMIYGKNVNFLSGPDITTVKDVSYFDSVSGCPSAYVTLTGSLIPLLSEPSLPILDIAKMNEYKAYAQAGVNLGIITDTSSPPDGRGDLGYCIDANHSSDSIGYTVNGTAEPTNQVYYYDGDINIKGPLSPGTTFLVVATGHIYIKDDLAENDGNLLGLITNKNVIIDTNSGADDNWEINALIVAPTGELKATGTPSITKNLNFNGGFVVGVGVNLATVFQGNRAYSYNINQKKLPKLPFIVYIRKWEEIP